MLIPQNIAPEGFKVLISCTFTGIKFIPFLSLANNSANPILILYDDHLVYKVLKKSTAKYSNIEKADASSNAFMQNLTLNFKNSVFTFSVSLNQREDLKEVIKFLRGKSVLLSERALELISGD